MSDTSLRLENHFLIAMPALNNPMFARSVIYICEHHDKGTIGLIINQPLAYSWTYIFDQLHITYDKTLNTSKPLLFGGPIQSDRGFVLHRPSGNWSSSLTSSSQEVTITTSRDILQAIAKSEGPEDAVIVLGYVGWDSKQLEQEIKDNIWLICPFTSELLYTVPYTERWNKAGLTLGINMDQLITGEGHA